MYTLYRRKCGNCKTYIIVIDSNDYVWRDGKYFCNRKCADNYFEMMLHKQKKRSVKGVMSRLAKILRPWDILHLDDKRITFFMQQKTVSFEPFCCVCFKKDVEISGMNACKKCHEDHGTLAISSLLTFRKTRDKNHEWAYYLIYGSQLAKNTV